MEIKNIRKKALLTQQEFAKALGVSLCAVQYWEQGICKPSFRSIRKILDFCQKNNIEIEI